MLGSVGAILASRPNDSDDFYQILGCSENASVDQITAEYRVRALKCHPDKNPDDLIALKEFQKLQEARDTLSDPEKRKAYDEWRHCGVSVSYEQWKHLRNRCQMTMHWATPKKEIMLENGGTAPPTSVPPPLSASKEAKNGTRGNNGQIGGIKWGPSCADAWEPDNESSNVFNAFRNYKI